MNDALLDQPDRKAELSFAYLGALCAYAGYICQRGPQPDRGSVDATVRAGGTMHPQFDVQLKATAVPDRRPDGLHFRLPGNNYADLAEAKRTSPIVLVVLELPSHEKDWLSCTDRRTGAAALRMVGIAARRRATRPADRLDHHTERPALGCRHVAATHATRPRR